LPTLSEIRLQSKKFASHWQIDASAARRTAKAEPALSAPHTINPARIRMDAPRICSPFATLFVHPSLKSRRHIQILALVLLTGK
jgi:hypothetical protein